MKLKSRLILLFILLGFFLTDILVFSTDQAPINYTIDNGISSNSITCLFQDSKGYLWIGTTDGLNRFDGFNFLKFRSYYDDTTTISNNYITSINEDIYGNLWVGTLLGLNRLDKKTKKFQRYYYNPASDYTISSNRINNIACDQKGNIWVLTDASLDLIDFRLKDITSFVFFNNFFNKAVEGDKSPILFDSKNRLWIGTKDGLNCFDSRLEQFERFCSSAQSRFFLSHDNINDLYESNEGVIWIATEKGLNQLKKEENKVSKFNVGRNSQNSINAIYKHNENVLWLGTEKGIRTFNIKSKEILSLSKFFNNDVYRSIDNQNIKCILHDNSDIVWIGTSAHGLYKYDKKGYKLFSYHYRKDGNALFADSDIQSVYLDKTNRLWVGTKKEGLYQLDRKSLKVKNFTSKSGLKLTDNNIHSFAEISEEKILIGTQNGLNELTLYPTIQLKQINDPLSILKNNPIHCIYKAKDSTVWIGSLAGLYKYSNGEVISSGLNDSIQPIPHDIYCLAEDNEGNLWIGTLDGLNKYNISSNKITSYKVEDYPLRSDWLSSNKIYSLYFSDNTNQLWVGTSNGLNKYIKSDNLFKVYTEYDGLPNNVIYSIECDNSNKLWISTNKGIALFDPSTEEVLAFDKGDGLQGYEFNLGSSYKSTKGEMFFGGKLGVNYFNPAVMKFNHHVPNIVINSFELYDNQGIKKLSIDHSDTIFIPHESNHFTIEFSALDFTRPEKCNFAYKLEGIDNDWINIGNNRKATFSNIPSGEYYFKVKGSNNDNLWNDEGTYIYLIIETPFWKSDLFIIFYGLAFIVLVIFVFQYRTKSLRKSNKILKEKEVASLELEKQREELIIKNKNITDSINYAKRIQEAIIPSEKFFKNILPSSFILYMPKDIVSGDFYWIAENENKIFLAVVDCTGHGVPGAFMSIIGFELLRNITLVQKIEDPSIVLNKLNNGVARTFDDGGATAFMINDGMDIAFCVINKETKSLEYAGAFNPLYIVRENKIVEVKADRHTVGLIKDDSQSFTKHIIPLEGIDMIYMFTDGYTDQFGGPQEKKFKFRRFRHLLLTIHKLSMTKQKIFLKESVDKWKGPLEQVDDILVVGIDPKKI